MRILNAHTGVDVELGQGSHRIWTESDEDLIVIYINVCPGCGREQEGEEVCESCESCPHADPFHDHGDGCPSCDVNICTTCHTVHSESKCPTCEEKKS